MSELRTVAVAQTCPVHGDVQGNVEEHVRLARAAAAAGAQVVVFPELSLTGYELDLARALAFSEDDARLAPLLETASTHAVTLIAGAPVRSAGRLHIGAFILSPGGAIELYTKQRMGAFSARAAADGTVPPPEATVFAPGERDPLIRFGDDVAALAVCADVGRAAHAEHAAARGANVYLASMFVIPSDFEDDAARLQAYAARHGMLVAMANFGSPSGGLAAAGRSSIWAPDGELLVRLDAAGSGVAVATRTDAGWQGRKRLLHGRIST